MLSVSHSRMLRLGHKIKNYHSPLEGTENDISKQEQNTAFKYQKYKTAAEFPLA